MPGRLATFPDRTWKERPMSAAGLEQLASKDFDGITMRRPGIWLVDFGTAWCAPCRVLEPVLAQLATQLAGRIGFGQLDADEESELASRFGVTAMPTMLLFRDGRVIGQRVGAMTKVKIVAWLESAGVAPVAAAAIR
jgi:thioredoxin 1